MSQDLIPVVNLSNRLINAVTNAEALPVAHALIQGYLQTALDPNIRSVIWQSLADPITSHLKRGKLTQAIETTFAEEPDPSTRDFKRLLLDISINDGSPEPEETFKRLETGRAAAEGAGVDVDALIQEFAAISSKGVAHMMLNRDVQLDLFKWYKQKDKSLDVRAIADAIKTRCANPGEAPVASKEELEYLEKALLNGVKETAEEAAWLISEVYAHPNTRRNQRSFIRKIGEYPYDLEVSSRLYKGAFGVYADEPDTPTRTLKRTFLAISIDNFKEDYRDVVTSYWALWDWADKNGANFAEAIAAIAPISTKRVVDLINMRPHGR